MYHNNYKKEKLLIVTYCLQSTLIVYSQYMLPNPNGGCVNICNAGHQTLTYKALCHECLESIAQTFTLQSTDAEGRGHS